MISVVIPVYNDWKRLERALDSIREQTVKDVEVIVVDDGSTERFKIEDLRLKINSPIQLIGQENRGAPAARNRGLAEAKGEYVIFWDADVVGRPEMLERLKRQLDLNLEASFAYSNFRLQISDCRINILKFAFCNLKSFESRRFNFEELKKNNFIHSTSLIRRKDAIKWDENLKRFQDWDLWLTMAEEGKIGVWIDEYLFIVLGGGRISTWFPSFAYRAPFKYLPWIRGQIKKHDQARDVVIKKHRLISGG